MKVSKNTAKLILMIVTALIMGILAKKDFGFHIYPILAEGLRVNLGIIFAPVAGIAFGPLLGAIVAGAGYLIGQFLAGSTAFVGGVTFLAAGLAALTAGMISKRNWLGAMFMALAVVIFWLYSAQEVYAAFYATIIIFTIILSIILSGFFGPNLLAKKNVLEKVLGSLLINIAGFSLFIFLGAAYSVKKYNFPDYAWNGINLYQDLGILYKLSFLSLIPAFIYLVIIPLLGLELGQNYMFLHKRLKFNVNIDMEKEPKKARTNMHGDAAEKHETSLLKKGIERIEIEEIPFFEVTAKVYKNLRKRIETISKSIKAIMKKEKK